MREEQMQSHVASFEYFSRASRHLLGNLPEEWVRENWARYKDGLRPDFSERDRLILIHAVWETDPRTASSYLPVQVSWLGTILRLVYWTVIGVGRRRWPFRRS